MRLDQIEQKPIKNTLKETQSAARQAAGRSGLTRNALRYGLTTTGIKSYSARRFRIVLSPSRPSRVSRGTS
jgi:DNA-binding NtrC family response regulator